MKKVIVLSTAEQFRVFCQMPEAREETQVFCDNEALYPELSERGVSFTALDEGILRGQWAEINAWSCGRISSWVARCGQKLPPGTPDAFPGLFLDLSLILISVVKNYKYAEHLLRTVEPSQIFVFEEAAPVGPFPFFSANRFLNYFLRELAEERKIPVRSLALPAKGRKSGDMASSFRLKVTGFLRRSLAFFLAKCPDSGTAGYFLVYGSLRHLSSLTDCFLKKSVPLVLFDNEFHGELYRYARSKGMPYLTADRLAVHSSAEIEGLAGRLRSQFDSRLQEAERSGFFNFDGHDLMPCLREVVFRDMTGYFHAASVEWFRCEDLLKRLPVKGCLVEEDFSMRANFCSFMKGRGVKNYCVSHAHTAFDFNVKDAEHCFSQSMTFVNSEHEKQKMYGARGWALSDIVVSGSPRYDRFAGLAGARSWTESPKRILYCAGALTLYTPDIPGYLGADRYTYGSCQLEGFKRLRTAAEDLPVEILIKPHYVGDAARWSSIVAGLKGKTPVKVLKHSEDFAKLLASSHAMVLTYWSTALIEAALCRTPAIYLNLEGQKSPSIMEFLDHGLCRYADTVSSLRVELQKITAVEGESGPLPQDAEFFLGKPPGQNTEIVADMILKAVSPQIQKKERVSR